MPPIQYGEKYSEIPNKGGWQSRMGFALGQHPSLLAQYCRLLEKKKVKRELSAANFLLLSSLLPAEPSWEAGKGDEPAGIQFSKIFFIAKTCSLFRMVSFLTYIKFQVHNTRIFRELSNLCVVVLLQQAIP